MNDGTCMIDVHDSTQDFFQELNAMIPTCHAKSMRHSRRIGTKDHQSQFIITSLYKLGISQLHIILLHYVSSCVSRIYL